LIAGASNEGKSIVLANIAYNNLIRKKNMFYASLEMSEKQCIYRLLALHSTHPKFGYNLEHKRIKAKDLTEREKEQLYDVATDLFECEDYGELFFTDTATTVAEIFDEAEDINRFKKLHGICIDYISLLQGKGSSEQAVIANNFKASKSKALLFNKGEQIPVISVHQIAEQKKEQAEESGKYDFNFLSDTSEAKKSSDVVSWILRTEQHRQVHELSWGINKVRDSDGVGNTYSLFEDFQHMRVQLIDTEIE
jgi:replicative DNA helicase